MILDPQSAHTGGYFQALLRDGAFLDLQQSWTITCWYQMRTSTPGGGGAFRDVFFQGSTAYIYLGAVSDTTNQLGLNINDGSAYDATTAAALLTLGTRVFLAITHDAVTHAIRFLVDGALVGTLTKDLTAWDFGGDQSQYLVGGVYGDQAVERLRIWQRCLTSSQLNAEALYPLAHSTSSLLSDNPLVDRFDVLDYSGHSRPFTSVDAALSTVTGPSLYIAAGSLALSGFGDTRMKFLAANGADLGVPASLPKVGTPSGTDGCDALFVFPNGRYGATATLCPDTTHTAEVFDANFNFAGNVASASARGGCIDGHGKAYTLSFGSGTRILHQFDATGAEITTWTLTIPTQGGGNFLDVIAVNIAGTRAYSWKWGGTHVYAFDLTTGAGPLTATTFVTLTGSDVVREGGLVDLATDELLVGVSDAATYSTIRRYTAAGSLQHTYTLTGGIGHVNGIAASLVAGVVWCNFADGSAYGEGFALLRLSDGVELERFSPPNSGFEWDGPFTVVRHGIGDPGEVTFQNDRVPGLTEIEITMSDGQVEAWSVIPQDDPLDYDHGPKRPRVLAWQDIRRASSDFYGQMIQADFKFTVRDKDLHVLGYLGDPANTFTNRYTVTRSISDPDRRQQLTRRVIFRGPIRSVVPRAGATHEFTVKDYLQERFGPNSDIAAIPRRKVLKEDFPGCEATKVNSSAEQYVVHGAHPMIPPGGTAPTAYQTNGAALAGATGLNVDTGTDVLLGTITFANIPDHRYTILTRTGMPSTAITFTPALAANVPDNTPIAIDYGGARIAVHNGVGTFAGDQIVFGNHATIYTAQSGTIDDPEKQIVLSPALTADVPDGTTITQTPTHQVTAAKGNVVPWRGSLRTDRKIVDGVDVGDGQGKTQYVGDEVQADGHTYGMFLWACHGCYSPSGKPIQQTYFFNEALDNLAGGSLYYNDVLMPMTIGTLATEAGSGGRVLLPGYANWTDNGFTTSHVDRNDRRYLIYGLRGMFRDWALGIRAAPQNLGGIAHAINAYGADTTLDGTGDEVLDIHDQFVLAFNNVAWGDYQAGAPLADPTFPDDPTLTLLDLDSVARAKAHGATLVDGGFRGALHMGVDNEQLTMSEFIKRGTLSMGLENGWNRKTQFMVDRVAYENAAIMDGAPTLTDERDIQKMSYEIDEAPTELFTSLRFVHSRDELGRATGGWRSSTADVNVASLVDEYADDALVIAEFSPSGTKIYSQPLQFYWLDGKNRSTDADAYQQGSDTINAILHDKLALAKVRRFKLTTWGKGYDIEAFDRLWIKHFANVGGRTPRPVRVVEHDAQPDRWRASLTCFDLKRVIAAHPLSYRVAVGSGSTPYAPAVDPITGDGLFPEGVDALIVADEPATGKIFDAWTGDMVANAAASVTTVHVLVGGASVAATYADADVMAPTYTLTVVGVGTTGSGSFAAAASRAITAPARTGFTFTGWTGFTVASPSSLSTTLTMPAGPVTVTATYLADAVPVTTGRYVSVGGHDYVTCSQAQSIGTPKQTISNALACVSAGDTLYVRGGYYDENITWVPNGVDLSSGKVRVVAYPGETVWLRPTTPTAGGNVIWLDGNFHHVEFDGINIDGRPSAQTGVWTSPVNGNNPHHIRVQNAEIIAGTPHGGAAAVNFGGHIAIGQTGSNEAINLVIHGGGVPGGGCGFMCNSYGIYLMSPNNLVDHCEIYGTRGAGIQVYNASGDVASGNVIRNSWIHDIVATEAVGEYWGIIVIGPNTLIYNVLISNLTLNTGNAGDTAIAIGCATGVCGSGSKIWNVTIYNAVNGGVLIGAGVSGVEVLNTLVYGGGGLAFSDLGSGTTQNHNLFAGADPVFVNAGADDYHLQAGSPARNTGTTVATVTTDRDGVARPQGGTYDIGCYERA